MSERAAPFYCPYCGDEDLRMFGEVHGEWRCGACQRVFRLGYLGRSAAWTSPVAAMPVAAMTESEDDR
jgi:ribosomal protein L37AE/L43A